MSRTLRDPFWLKELFIITVVCLLVAGGPILHLGSLAMTTLVVHEYHDEVGSYVKEAATLEDPDAIIESLDRAEQGLHNLGIADSYAAPYPWKQHRGCSVERTLTHWESIKHRAQEAKQWRTEHSSKATDFDAMGDQYAKRIDRIHDMVKSNDVDCDSAKLFVYSDGNAFNAWLSVAHPVVFFIRYWLFLGWIVPVSAFVAGLVGT